VSQPNSENLSETNDIDYLEHLADILEQKGAIEHATELRRVAKRLARYIAIEVFILNLTKTLPYLTEVIHATTKQKSDQSKRDDTGK
jgi:hypothetical protein